MRTKHNQFPLVKCTHSTWFAFDPKRRKNAQKNNKKTKTNDERCKLDWNGFVQKSGFSTNETGLWDQHTHTIQKIKSNEIKKNWRKKSVRRTCQRIAHVKNRMVIVSIFDYETTRTTRDRQTQTRARYVQCSKINWFNRWNSQLHFKPSTMRWDEMCEFGWVVYFHSGRMVEAHKLLLHAEYSRTQTHSHIERTLKSIWAARENASSTLSISLLVFVCVFVPLRIGCW